MSLLTLLTAQRRRLRYKFGKFRFPAALAAPLPATYKEAGAAGSLAMTDATNAMSTDGKLRFASGAGTAHGTSAWGGASLSRAIGRAVYARIIPGDSGTMRLGWSTTSNSWLNIDVRPVPAAQFTCESESGSATVYEALAAATEYEFAVILRSPGVYYLVRGGAYAEWMLAWVDNASTAAPLWPAVQSYSAVNAACDDLYVADLGGMWASQYGPAISRVASPTSGTAAYMDPDAVVEFTWTPAAGETLELDLRRYDADNRWIMRCAQAGGTIKIVERNAGVETERASSAQTWTVGTAYRIVVTLDGPYIRPHVAGVAKTAYLSANFNRLATECRASGFGAGSDLVVWPRHPDPFSATPSATRGALGAADETRVLSIASDSHVMHVGDPGYSSAGELQLAAWRDAANTASPDLAVVNGDIAFDTDGSIADAGAILSALAHKLAVLGNHDIGYVPGEYARHKTLAVADYGIPSESGYYSGDLGSAFHYVVLDGNYDAGGNPYADIKSYLPQAELDWLAADLAATTRPGILVFMHNPPRTRQPGAPEDYFDPASLARIQAILDSKPSVFLFAGHWHPTNVYFFRLGAARCFVGRRLDTTKAYYTVAVSHTADGQIAVNVLERTLP